MRLYLEIAGKRRSALIDTGASRSLIRRDVWLDICKESHRAPVMQTGEVLKSLSGHVLPTLGRTSIDLRGNTLYFYIVNELQNDLLIGGDSLETLEAVIDFKTHEVTFSSQKIKGELAKISELEIASFHTAADRWAQKYPDVFNLEGGLRCTNLVQMEIDTGSAIPINQRPYRLPLRKRQIVDEEIEKMLSEGIIERSSSAWASPITLVPKKDGSIRFCVDYRKLNAVTRKDAHPIPNIQDILDNLAGASVFTTLDLKSGYWQVPMSEEAQEKTAFSTHRGLFHFKRMPFGLTNAPALFQRLMNRVLAQYIGTSVMVYLDDIVIFSRSPVDHEKHVSQVFEALRQAGLTVKLSKCAFGQKEVKLLGYIVSGQGIRSDPEKTRAINEMAPPTDVKGVRSFLGMCNYYRQCIPNYARVASPLVKLTHKYVKFLWGKEEHEAWQTLRDLLVSDVIMAHPQLDQPYKLYTDACNYAVGAILCQEDEDGIERPVQYISKQLSGAALKWATIEKEAFAVVFALNKLRPYLYGAEFTIYTDHKPLKSLFLSEVKNTKIQRWAVLLAEYSAPIEYRQGPNNIRADMLSRIKPRVDIDRNSLTINAVVEEDEIPWDFDSLEKSEIVREQRLMNEYRLGLEDDDDYAVTDGLLYTLVPPPGKPEYPRLVLPPSARFRVIRRAHAEVGHQGMRKTLDRIQEAYKWPKMRKEVYVTLSKCAKCAVHRTRREYASPTAMPIADYPSQIIGMDMCGPFPESRHGNRYILTLIDHCTGWVEVKPLPNKTAEGIVRYLSNEYVPRYGPPEVIITDQGLEFKNQEVMGYLKSLGTEVRHSSPFHPQTNGKIERFHRTFKGILRTFINARPSEWEDHLGATLWAHRVSTSTVTGYTPFFLTFGRRPRVPFQRLYTSPLGQEGNALATRLSELYSAFRAAALHTADSRRYNHKRLMERANAGELQVGDSVVILANDASPLDPKWDHGYVVIGIRGSVVTAQGPGMKKRVVNREKVRVVDPDTEWDALRQRQTRAKRGNKRRKGLNMSKQSPPGPQVIIAHPLMDVDLTNALIPPNQQASTDQAANPEIPAPRSRTTGPVLPASRSSTDEVTGNGISNASHIKRPCTRSQTRLLLQNQNLQPVAGTKRRAPPLDDTEVQEQKRRCIEFAISFLASLP